MHEFTSTDIWTSCDEIQKLIAGTGKSFDPKIRIFLEIQISTLCKFKINFQQHIIASQKVKSCWCESLWLCSMADQGLVNFHQCNCRVTTRFPVKKSLFHHRRCTNLLYMNGSEFDKSHHRVPRRERLVSLRIHEREN